MIEVHIDAHRITVKGHAPRPENKEKITFSPLSF